MRLLLRRTLVQLESYSAEIARKAIKAQGFFAPYLALRLCVIFL